MLGVNGFGQVVIEAVLGPTARGARGGGQAESDKNQVATVPRLAEALGDAAAVDERRADGDDADIWTHRLQQLQPAFNVGRVVNQVPGRFEGHSQSLASVRAVFDQQDAPGPCPPFHRERDPRRDAWRGDLLHSDRKPAAASFSSAGCGDGAAVQLDEAADQSEADPETGLRMVQCAINLHIHVEDERQERRRDAEARVLDAEDSVPVFGAQGDSICPPDGVYLTALVMMLVRTCWNRTASHTTHTGSMLIVIRRSSYSRSLRRSATGTCGEWWRANSVRRR
jgi:hypothetical protein